MKRNGRRTSPPCEEPPLGQQPATSSRQCKPCLIGAYLAAYRPCAFAVHSPEYGAHKAACRLHMSQCHVHWRSRTVGSQDCLLAATRLSHACYTTSPCDGAYQGCPRALRRSQQCYANNGLDVGPAWPPTSHVMHCIVTANPEMGPQGCPRAETSHHIQ